MKVLKGTEPDDRGVIVPAGMSHHLQIVNRSISYFGKCQVRSQRYDIGVKSDRKGKCCN